MNYCKVIINAQRLPVWYAIVKIKLLIPNNVDKKTFFLPVSLLVHGCKFNLFDFKQFVHLVYAESYVTVLKNGSSIAIMSPGCRSMQKKNIKFC